MHLRDALRDSQNQFLDSSDSLAAQGHLGVTARANRHGHRWIEVKAQDRVVDAVTAFSGSTSFIYLHIFWFLTWIIVNSGCLGQQPVFDRFPFGLLTLIVSLEAIFLSTFVLITQNRQGSKDAVKEELNFETDVRAEIWTIQIGQKLGLDANQIEQTVQDTIRQARKSSS